MHMYTLLQATYARQSVMLNRILHQQRLRVPLHARLQRRPNQVVEQERAIHQQRKSTNLQPLERLPAEAKRDDPDEERAACIDC
jgi:hypothetical protein